MSCPRIRLRNYQLFNLPATVPYPYCISVTEGKERGNEKDKTSDLLEISNDRLNCKFF